MSSPVPLPEGREVRLPLARLLAFVLVGVALHAALYVAYARTVGREHQAAVLDRAFLEAEEPVRVLFSGNSHVRNGIDDDLVPGGRNIAVGGEHYLKTFFRLRWLLEHSDHPVRAVVLPLEVGSFTGWKTDTYSPEYVWGRYVPFWELGMRKERALPYTRMLLKAWVVPYLGELETVAQYAEGRKGFRYDDDVGRFDLWPPQARAQAARDAAAEHFAGAEAVDRGKLWAFHQLRRLLEERGIRAIYVALPVSEAYVEAQRRYGVRKRVGERVLQPLLATGEVEFVDHEDLWFGQDRFFVDPHHLNAEGRARYTRILGRELVRRGVIEAPKGGG